nr:hypothetical protein [Angustibacter aerolatus]
MVPVVRRLLADAETPLGVYRKARPRRAGHVPARVGGARRRLVAVLHRRRAGDRHPHRARGRGALDRHPAGRPAHLGRPHRRAARHRGGAAHPGPARPAAAHRGPGGRAHLRRRAALGAGCPTATTTTSACPRSR